MTKTNVQLTEKVLGELYGNAQAYRLSRKGSCIVQP